MKVRKAIIPAAGLGTRMLPATKSQPKEMLTIVDKPVIQYVVEEAVESGITDILMVTSAGKESIRSHFDRNFPNAIHYKSKGKHELLKLLRGLGELCNIEYTAQKELRGLGDAVLCGEPFVGREPFAVLLGDTICTSGNEYPVLAQLLHAFTQFGFSAVALEEVPIEMVSKYGVMGGQQVSPGVYKASEWVEKPAPEDAPGNLAIASRYVFTSEIFECLKDTHAGLNNEVQLTDAMKRLLLTQEMYGVAISGNRYDIGNKLDFIKTNVAFGLEHAEIGGVLKDWISSIRS